MTEKPKTSITPATRLAAFALISMARQHNNCAMAHHAALNKTLGYPEDNQGRFSDLIWGFDFDQVTAEQFDEALKLESISVVPDPLADEASALIKALNEATEAATDPIFGDAADMIRKLLQAVADRGSR